MESNARQKSGSLAPPIRPNMMVLNGDGKSSTLGEVDFSHSVLTRIKLFNSLVHQSSLEGCSFEDCDFDGSMFNGCSLRGVEFTNCDVDRLVINGVNVGLLLRMLGGPLGGK